MRTNIVIDDQLMTDAMKASGAASKRQAVELGLKMLIQRDQQRSIRTLRGRLNWDGDLEEMRTAR